MAETIEVAVAVLERQQEGKDEFLLAQRPEGKVYAGYWEFPGGKVEPGERVEAALARELHEELGIGLRRAYPWITRVFTYPHGTVRLNFFRVVEWEGEPQSREGQAFLWQQTGRLTAAPMLPANAPVLAALGLPLIYAVTSAESLGVDEQLRRLDAALAAGVKLVQVRDKTLPAPERERLAAQAIGRAHAAGARVLLNDGPETAARLGADGVHCSAAALARLKARPAGMLCGASCHSAVELARAGELGLDFAVLGPIHPTATHPGAPGLGWEGFARIAAGAQLPVYAIGGLRHEDMGRARAAGAHGLAMIRGAWGQPFSPLSGSAGPVSGTR